MKDDNTFSDKRPPPTTSAHERWFTPRHHVRLLLVVHVPKLDGFSVARQIRGDPELRKLPLVAVTASAMRGDRERVMAAGFDGYITKPISPEEFVSQLESVLKSRSVATPDSATRNGKQ